jgi:hypothetical protein
MTITPESMAAALAEEMNATRLRGIAALAPNAITAKAMRFLEMQGTVSLAELIAAFEVDLANPDYAHAREMVTAALTHLRTLSASAKTGQTGDRPSPS